MPVLCATLVPCGSMDGIGTPNGHIVQYVIVVFECEYQSGELAVSDESTDIGYFPTDALPENTMLSHHIRIEDALANLPQPVVR